MRSLDVWSLQIFDRNQSQLQKLQAQLKGHEEMERALEVSLTKEKVLYLAKSWLGLQIRLYMWVVFIDEGPLCKESSNNQKKQGVPKLFGGQLVCHVSIRVGAF